MEPKKQLQKTGELYGKLARGADYAIFWCLCCIS